MRMFIVLAVAASLSACTVAEPKLQLDGLWAIYEPDQGYSELCLSESPFYYNHTVGLVRHKDSVYILRDTLFRTLAGELVPLGVVTTSGPETEIVQFEVLDESGITWQYAKLKNVASCPILETETDLDTYKTAYNVRWDSIVDVFGPE